MQLPNDQAPEVGTDASRKDDQQAGDVLVARINPFELRGDEREEYLSNLWEVFTNRAQRGFAHYDMIMTIAHEMNIECDDDSLFDTLGADCETDEELAQREWDFNAVVEIFDDVSRRQTDRFREMDIDQQQIQHEVPVGPLSYLWYRMPCATK